MKKVFLVPVYNEEKNLPRLLDAIGWFARTKNWDFVIYAVNDGSVDGTLKVLAFYEGRVPLKVFSLEKNSGPGAAFKRGFQEILKGEGEDALIITLEADSTSDLSILESMANKAEGGVDLVLASCYADGGGIKGTTLSRRMMSMSANFMIGLMSMRPDIKTYSSFYRIYRYPAISRLYKLYGKDFMEETGFACAVELFMKLARLRISIEEVPMLLDCKRRIGKSRMKVLPTILAYFRIFCRSVMRGVSFWMITKKRT